MSPAFVNLFSERSTHASMGTTHQLGARGHDEGWGSPSTTATQRRQDNTNGPLRFQPRDPKTGTQVELTVSWRNLSLDESESVAHALRLCDVQRNSPQFCRNMPSGVQFPPFQSNIPRRRDIPWYPNSSPPPDRIQSM